jgi:hypothetical protein
MAILDIVVAAVSPPESEEARIDARAKTQSTASVGDWLSMVLEHHRQIEEAFADVNAATSAAERVSAQAELAVLLTAMRNLKPPRLIPSSRQARPIWSCLKRFLP